MTIELTPPAAQRVLCYAPHNRWVVHGQWDMTIVHGLRHRAADAALSSQPGVARLAADNQRPYEWLGRSLDPKEAREARRWVSSLARDELLDAAYGDWKIAVWV